MSQVELVRERWTFDHIAPDVRSITLEYTVRNMGEQELFQLFLPLHAFLANLRVLDEDGRDLNYLPNREVEQALRELREEDPEAFRRTVPPFAHPRYRISIVLPKDAPLRPGEIRTVRLLHTDGERPRYKRWSALTLPSYHIQHRRRVGQVYGLHVAVNAPPDTHLTVEVDDASLLGDSHYHATPESEIDYHFNAYLPPPEKRGYRWQANYELGPARMVEPILTGWLILAFALGAWILAASFSPAVPALGRGEMFAVAGAVSATSAGLLLGLKEAWASRYLLLLLPAFLVSAVAWLRWFVLGG